VFGTVKYSITDLVITVAKDISTGRGLRTIFIVQVRIKYIIFSFLEEKIIGE